jgi:hypothetical protein
LAGIRNNSVTVLDSAFESDATLSFPMRDGRQLTILRDHRITCRIAFLRVQRGAVSLTFGGAPQEDIAKSASDEDFVDCQVDVADETGAMFRTLKTLSANAFLEAVRTAHTLPSRGATLEPLLSGIYYRHDHRWYLPALAEAYSERGSRGVVYYLKNLVGTLDLLKWCPSGGHTELVIRVAALDYGAPGGGGVPEVTVATGWAARFILLTKLVSEGRHRPDAPTVFDAIEDRAPAQAGVQVR